MLSIVLVMSGLGAGWALYGRRPRESATEPDPLQRALPGTFALLGARLKIDELYWATLGRANTLLAVVADGLDRFVWGAAIAFLARFGEFIGAVNREADEGGLNRGFDAGSASLRRAGRTYSSAQSGSAHGYLRTLVVAFVMLAIVLTLGGTW